MQYNYDPVLCRGGVELYMRISVVGGKSECRHGVFGSVGRNAAVRLEPYVFDVFVGIDLTASQTREQRKNKDKYKGDVFFNRSYRLLQFIIRSVCDKALNLLFAPIYLCVGLPFLPAGGRRCMGALPTGLRRA